MSNRFHFDPAEVAADGPEADLPLGRPLHVEVGFGKDVRILREAEQRPDEWFLGVEISRKKAVKFCHKVARAGLRNVRAYQGDVRLALRQMLPPASVSSFTILFPDPWPKRRHRKHRWIREETAQQVARALVDGGEVTVATDHAGYLEQIRAGFLAAGLVLEHESTEIPAGDRTLFAERFERLAQGVTYQRWRKAGLSEREADRGRRISTT
ncbi:MAG: tRNA (guanine(46)-N(7))-methyltransferase TrmB [Planctomycetota bacterium]|jgi:tRNA (guanine-N(7)-)-methyltransferase